MHDYISEPLDKFKPIVILPAEVGGTLVLVGLRYSRRDDFCNVSSDFLATLGTFCAEVCGIVTAVGGTEAAATLGTLATTLGAVGTIMAAALTASVFLTTGLVVALAVLVFGRLFDPLPTIWGPACKFFVASEAEAAAATTAAAVAAAEGVATLTVGGAPGTGGAIGVVGRCTDTGGCCEVTVAAGGC